MYNSTVRTIFTGWLIRDFDFPFLEARKEYTRISSCSSRIEYLRMSRIGSYVALNRELRNNVYDTFLNAKRHKSIIDEMNGISEEI